MSFSSLRSTTVTKVIATVISEDAVLITLNSRVTAYWHFPPFSFCLLTLLRSETPLLKCFIFQSCFTFCSEFCVRKCYCWLNISTFTDSELSVLSFVILVVKGGLMTFSYGWIAPGVQTFFCVSQNSFFSSFSITANVTVESLFFLPC